MEKGKSLVNVDVEKALSSVWVKMPCVNVEIQKVILPSVSQILYQVETIVSSSSQSLDEATDLWWDKSEVHLEESYGQDDYDSHHCTLRTHPFVCQPGSQGYPRRNRLGYPQRNRQDHPQPRESWQDHRQDHPRWMRRYHPR